MSVKLNMPQFGQPPLAPPVSQPNLQAPMPQMPGGKFMDPMNQFFMTAGAGMMGQGYSPTPTNAFTGMQNAFGAGQNAYQNALILQNEEKDRALAEQERQAKIKLEAQKKAQLEQMLKGVPPQQAAMLRMMEPQKAIETLWSMSQPKETDNFAGSSYMDDAMIALRMPTDRPLTPEEAAAVAKKAEALRLLENPPPPNPYADPFVAASANRGATFMENVDKGAQGAVAKMGTLHTMQKLNETIESGSPLAPMYTQLQALAQDFAGLDISVDDPASAKEAYDALAIEMVRKEREYGPKDARFTDADMRLYLTSLGTMENTPAGRKLILAVVMGREQEKLEKQRYMENQEAMYLSQGASEGEAMKKAISDTKKWARDRAENPTGVFIDKKTGELTPLGLQLQKATGKPIQAGGSSGEAPETKVVNGVTYRKGPDGLYYAE